jgi:hypothetical protein
MKKLMMIVAVVALILALPATASAHKLRKGFAVKQSQAVAQDFATSHFFFTEQDTVFFYNGGYTQKELCQRLSKHKILCEVVWGYRDETSGDEARCVGDANSKLKRRSNKVVTTLRESDVVCEPVLPVP